VDGRLGAARGADVRLGADRVLGVEREGGDTVRVVPRDGET
jgi:hypothetical protein